MKLISWGKQLYAKNYVSAFDGNLSVRADSDLILITRSGCMKGLLCEEDFVLINSKGQLQDRPDLLQPKVGAVASSETIMHLTVYNRQPLAQAVFHAHPPTAVAYCVAHPSENKFPLKFTSELILALGQVPIVSYQRPGTRKMGETLIPHLDKAKVMILQFHGVVSWGEDIDEAYRGVERLEHAAEIFWKAKTMGHVAELPEDEILALEKLREKIGMKTL